MNLEKMTEAIAKHLGRGVKPSDCEQTAQIAVDGGYGLDDFELTCAPSMVTRPGYQGASYRQPPMIKIKQEAMW